MAGRRRSSGCGGGKIGRRVDVVELELKVRDDWQEESVGMEGEV